MCKGLISRQSLIRKERKMDRRGQCRLGSTKGPCLVYRTQKNELSIQQAKIKGLRDRYPCCTTKVWTIGSYFSEMSHVQLCPLVFKVHGFDYYTVYFDRTSEMGLCVGSPCLTVKDNGNGEGHRAVRGWEVPQLVHRNSGRYSHPYNRLR